MDISRARRHLLTVLSSTAFLLFRNCRI